MADSNRLQATSLAPAPARITPRSVVLGLLMSAVAIGIIAWAEWVEGAIQIGYLQIPPVAVALIFVVVLLNRLAGALWPRVRLRPTELGVIYVMMLFASMIASRGLTERVYSSMVGVNYAATPANHWQKLFFPYIKQGLVPWSTEGGIAQPVAKYYYEGLPTGGHLPWLSWAIPTAMWLLLYALVYMAFMGLAAIVYKLWADEEHLAFPLTKLPLELASGDHSSQDFLRNRLMWLGFAAAMILFGVNGLHAIWPNIPGIKTLIPVSFQAYPWSAMSGNYLVISLAGVGLFYLLSNEMVFSLWFFFVFARLQQVLAATLAGPPTGGYFHAAGPLFISDQNAGVYFVLVGLMIYNAWSRLRDTWRRQVRGDPEAANTLVNFRTALILLGVAVAGIVVWWCAAGGSVAMALWEFGIYLFFQALIMSRATAEAGAPMTEGSFTPFDLWRAFSPGIKVSPGDLTLLSFTNGLFVRDLRGMTLTGMLDAQNVADGVGLRRRKIVGIMLTSMVFAVVVSGVLLLHLAYTRGGATMYSYIFSPRSNPVQGFHQNGPTMEGIEQVFPLRTVWLAVGALLCLFLGAMRRLYVWWPFHPLGAALSISWIVIIFWFPAFIAWLLKSVITRYGGVRTYIKLRPLFLGFVFGEFFAAVFWTVISFIFQTNPPTFPWG
jgi:hypothetical protein